MANLLEHCAARIAFWHARGVQRRFERALTDLREAERRVLARVISLVGAGEFGRAHGLSRVYTLEDLRGALPIATYEDYRPIVERLCAGETRALFSPGTSLIMFATSSGTTAAPKLVPVTFAFVEDYRRGWNVFGLKLLCDHPAAVLRGILQSSGRYDAQRTAAGIPCGAITGLLARTQKRIVRRFYVGRPEIALIPEPPARYYTLMRLGITRDVAFAITANPATLIQMARVADERSEELLRDVHDGTLSPAVVPDDDLRATLSVGLEPQRDRARELERLRAAAGRLQPRDYWQIEFLACWTGGSLGHYLERLRNWWGDVPVRDVGLLASEGRVSIPIEDNTPVGVLDISSGVFEFIPAEQSESSNPDVLRADEVQPGADYVVVLSNTSGLLRYRLDDVVRVHGFHRQAPLVEFLHRTGRVVSIAGEKLTENQVVAAYSAACSAEGVKAGDFLLAPCWGDPPFFRLIVTGDPDCVPALAASLDRCIAKQNEEYASRRRSGRLGTVVGRHWTEEDLRGVERVLRGAQGAAAEQFKRPSLLLEYGADERLLSEVRQIGGTSL